jgi:hypothetical protein
VDVEKGMVETPIKLERAKVVVARIHHQVVELAPLWRSW